MSIVLSYISLILGIFSFLASIVSHLSADGLSLEVFGYATVTYLICALFSRVLPFKDEYITKTNSQLLVLWLITAALASIPFILFTHITQPTQSLDIVSCLFEATSGITSTGLSMFSDIEKIPRSVLFWRSSLQWLGGLSVVVWITFFVRDFDLLNKLSSHEIGIEKKTDDEYRRPSRVAIFYLIATVLLFVFLNIGEMTSWEALNYAMTIISTGGFSIYNDSFSRFSFYSQWIAIIFMFISSLNLFLIVNSLFNFDLKRFFNNYFFKQFALISLTLFILLSLLGNIELSMDFIFNFVSAATTTGLSAAPLSQYNIFILLFICITMFLGAMNGSTAGGLKQKNIFYFYKCFKILIFERSFKNHNQEELANTRRAILAVFSWAISLILACMAVSYFEGSSIKLAETLFDTTSALTNSGLNSGMISINSSIQTKFIFILLMLIGRVNISSLIYIVFVAIAKISRAKEKLYS